MIQIHTKKASDTKNMASTLVTFAKKGSKHIEPVVANKELSSILNGPHLAGLELSDLKKGVFLRGVKFADYQNLLIIGLDDKYKQIEDARKLGASVYQLLKANKQESASVTTEGILFNLKDTGAAIQAFTEGVWLAEYKFDEYKTKKKEKDKPSTEVDVKNLHLVLAAKTNEKTVKKSIETAQVLSECVNFSRRLGDLPGNLLTPAILADTTVAAAKGTKLKVTVWDKAKIKKEGFGGLMGVSLGSANDPRFIIMEYHGAGKSKQPVCFVGKGLTFDSGGISIKPSGGMEEMKYDMCGGANVIGTMLAIAKLKLKINAIGLVPSTENMPGPLATKPGDIFVARNGKTVEVDNTDAEGRLILMDALSYATEQKPCAIFDAATLTGAIVVALGNSYTGVFTRDEKVRKNISQAADKSGEGVWHMPINDHHLSDMKGTYADLNNISSFRGAGSSTAAAFLEQFVGEKIPWAHFDIAGTAWHVGSRLNYCPKKGASGVMIRTFVELAQIYG